MRLHLLGHGFIESHDVIVGRHWQHTIGYIRPLSSSQILKLLDRQGTHFSLLKGVRLLFVLRSCSGQISVYRRFIVCCHEEPFEERLKAQLKVTQRILIIATDMQWNVPFELPDSLTDAHSNLKGILHRLLDLSSMTIEQFSRSNTSFEHETMMSNFPRPLHRRIMSFLLLDLPK
jgi:hypothetical protein